MEASSSNARKLFQMLFASAIQRCRLAGTLCRLTVSLKCFHDSQPPSARITISDTGVGSSLVEFRDLFFAATDKWDGMLSITTTGIHDKDINHYLLNVGEAVSSRKRLARLPSTHKNVGTFSGTEVGISTAEDNVYGLVVWVIRFVKKMLILKVADIGIEVLVEHISTLEPSYARVLQETDHAFLSASTSSIERLVSGLGDYALKHENNLSRECQSCFPSRKQLKIGSGLCSTENIRGTGKIMEAVILIAEELSDSSQPCCWKVSHTTTQVLYFQDFCPCSIPQSSVTALTSINWRSYGLILSGIVVDTEGNAVLEWETSPSFGRMTIALHIYRGRIILPQSRQNTTSDRNLVKKGVKIALDNFKEKHTGLFLSSHALKILDYVPDLSSAIAGLIFSSDDLDFRGDCSTLLGIESVDSVTEENIEDCIREKIIGIVETNDRNPKIHRDIAPSLFDHEILCEEDCISEEDEDTEDASILD